MVSREPAERHELLDDDGAGHDDVGALGLEARDAPTAAQRQGRKAQAERAHLRAVEREAVDRGAPAVARSQIDSGERTHGASERDQPSGRARRQAQGLELIAHVAAERRDLRVGGRIVTQEPAGDPHRAQRQARHRHDLTVANGRELQAAAAQIGHHRIAEGEAAQRGDGTEAGFFLPPRVPRPRYRRSGAVGRSGDARSARPARPRWRRPRREAAGRRPLV